MLRLFLLALVACAATVALASDRPPSPPPVVSAAALEIACELSLVDCSRIQAPAVFFDDLLIFNAYGMYPWPGVIVLDVSLKPLLEDPEHVHPGAFSILIHEMAHHIDFATGALVLGNGESICASEARAWHVSNTWSAAVGIPQSWDWLKGYEQCRL
jgi:hypothetical protein